MAFYALQNFAREQDEILLRGWNVPSTLAVNF